MKTLDVFLCVTSCFPSENFLQGYKKVKMSKLHLRNHRLQGQRLSKYWNNSLCASVVTRYVGSGIKVVSLTAVFWMLHNSSTKRCVTSKKRQRGRVGSKGWDQGSGIRSPGSGIKAMGSGSQGQTSRINTTSDLNPKIMFSPNNPSLPQWQVKTVSAAL